tara:strand:+ start:1434 stop:2039 length:606 start_codon:yes stop_codon:yes gene_type:complete
MLLITGCGCSGTTYIAEVLRRHGLDIGHDTEIGKDGIVTNAKVHDEIWIYNFGFNGEKEYIEKKVSMSRFNKVIQIVRHPLQVISSIMKKWETWGKVWLHIEIGLLGVGATPTLLNAMKYWLLWNNMVELYATDRLRAEDVFRDNSVILDKLNIKLKTQIDYKVASSNKEKVYSWKDLENENIVLTKQIKELALKYGYSLT